VAREQDALTKVTTSGNGGTFRMLYVRNGIIGLATSMYTPPEATLLNVPRLNPKP
jgi:hypothetical protein